MSLNFICIGAQKAGTTWLFKRLSELNDFNMLPVKEIHYFDKSDQYPTRSLIKNNRFIKKIQDPYWRKYSTGDILASIKSGKGLIFKLKYYYFNSAYNDEWYLSLFKNRSGICGDITPGYALLKTADIQRMKIMAPDAKIIYLLRNPIDRAWSQYKYARRHKKFHQIDIEDAKSFFNSDKMNLRNNYLETLRKYAKVYEENQLMIVFYDAIIQQPKQLLTQIVSFIGGNITNTKPEKLNLRSRDNSSLKMEIPDELHQLLTERYLNDIQQLSDIFGGYFSDWINPEKNISAKQPVIIINQKLINELKKM